MLDIGDKIHWERALSGSLATSVIGGGVGLVVGLRKGQPFRFASLSVLNTLWVSGLFFVTRDCIRTMTNRTEQHPERESLPVPDPYSPLLEEHLKAQREGKRSSVDVHALLEESNQHISILKQHFIPQYTDYASTVIAGAVVGWATTAILIGSRRATAGGVSAASLALLAHGVLSQTERYWYSNALNNRQHLFWRELRRLHLVDDDQYDILTHRQKVRWLDDLRVPKWMPVRRLEEDELVGLMRESGKTFDDLITESIGEQQQQPKTTTTDTTESNNELNRKPT